MIDGGLGKTWGVLRSWESKSASAGRNGTVTLPLVPGVPLPWPWQQVWPLPFLSQRSQNTRSGFQEDRNSGWKGFPNQDNVQDWGEVFPWRDAEVENSGYILREQTWELGNGSLRSRGHKRNFSTVCCSHKIPSLCSGKPTNPRNGIFGLFAAFNHIKWTIYELNVWVFLWFIIPCKQKHGSLMFSSSTPLLLKEIT